MKEGSRVHFIGIGGAGMSGLAEVYHCRGYRVQGSDIKKTRVTDRLEARGITVKYFHSAENIQGSDYVVYSSCIKEDNSELSKARQSNIFVLRRIEALNALLGTKDIVAISGTHGKTTISSLVSFLLIEAGLDPTVFIGGEVYFLNGNSRYGKSNLVVTEADESDGSFLLLRPLYSVATNIDKEHMDYYKTMDEVIASYREFIENTKDEGCAFVCIDDPNLKAITSVSSKRIMRYGFSSDADIKAENIELLGLDGSRFDLVLKNKVLGRIDLSITGTHNILNSLASIGIAMDLGVNFGFINSIISNFKGADRRFVVNRIDPDILIIDDYAHHPTEIKTTLNVLAHSGRRIVTVFQPHRYSRTKYLKEQFGEAFGLTDHLVITDIYSAYEDPIDNVSAEDICESARKWGHKDAHFVPKQDLVGHLLGVVKQGDAVFIFGAGDIAELPAKIIKALNGRSILS